LHTWLGIHRAFFYRWLAADEHRLRLGRREMPGLAHRGRGRAKIHTAQVKNLRAFHRRIFRVRSQR
jgi:hypothetical protein